jgi:hypothetical protein
VDDGDGEIGYRRFLHSDKQTLKAFYRKCGEDAVLRSETPYFMSRNGIDLGK